MKNLAWIDGTVSDIADARVSIEDRGYLLGDGVYEVIRVYGSQPFYLQAHLERLKNSSDAIKITLPYSLGEIEEAARDLLRRSGYSDGYIYMQLTRGSAKRDHLFPEGITPTLIMYVREVQPLQALETVKPARCITLPDERWMNCYIKTINLLPNLLARQKAAEAGALEALLYRPGDILTEGTRSNLFALIDDKVLTHPATNLILPGITRQIVIKLMENHSISFREEAFTLEDLKRASEVWITSTTLEVQPVGEIDGSPFSFPAPGSVAKLLMEEFRKVIAENL